MSVLVCLDDGLSASAAGRAQLWGLTLVGAEWLQQPGFHLCLDASGLYLQEGAGGKARVQVDFCAGASAHRRQFGGGLGQDIAKAVGVTGAYQPSVIDATAGLGRDSFVLASLGCRVDAHERQPVVAALLDDGLRRAVDDPDVGEIVARIRLHFGSSHDLLVPAATIADQPDVVYLDPMFAEDAKGSAQVKKDMQAFRQLVGSDLDADDLLQRAIDCARCRVVVKRGRKAAPLAGRSPSYQLVGKSSRFDVYSKAKVEPLSVSV